MMRPDIQVRNLRAKAPDEVVQLVDKVRAQGGVERILVVYGERGSSIYVEGQPRAPRPSERSA